MDINQFLEAVGDYLVEGFVEVSVDVESGLDGRVLAAMSRAAWVWRRSWKRMGWPTDAATAGSQERFRKLRRLNGAGVESGSGF